MSISRGICRFKSINYGIRRVLVGLEVIINWIGRGKIIGYDYEIL